MSDPKEPPADLPLVAVAQLTDAFARVGVEPGDTVLMHSSLKSLGRMDGGADGVIDAALAAAGPGGHVLMPTHSYCYLDAEGRGTPYDPAVTPSRTGLITEVFRQRRGAVRSGHPTHSVAAMGPLAELLVRGHAPDRGTFNEAGPHGRYVRWSAKIVFLGVGLSANTTYHAVEEWLALPYMPDHEVLLARPAGPPAVVIVNRPSGHRNFYRNAGLNLPSPVTGELEQRGLIRRVRLNQTDLLLVHSRDVVRVTVECEMKDPGALLCRQDACAFCELARHNCIRQRKETLLRGRLLLARPEMCDPNHPPVE